MPSFFYPPHFCSNKFGNVVGIKNPAIAGIFVLIAEREGFEPSVQVEARTTV